MSVDENNDQRRPSPRALREKFDGIRADPAQAAGTEGTAQGKGRVRVK